MRPLLLASLLIAAASIAAPDGGTLGGTIGIGSISSAGRVEPCAKRVRVDDAHLRCDDPPAPREIVLQHCVRTSTTETKTSLTLSCEKDTGVTYSVTLRDPRAMMRGGFGSGGGSRKPKK